ncbi:MAG: hypothetical protein CSA75_02630, partial [Sorangium cellulosum]
MAPKFGVVFIQSSFEPLRIASGKLVSGRLSEAMEALGRDSLQSGYNKGVGDAARVLGVTRERLENLLPSQQISSACYEVERCQQLARSSMGQFAGGLGGAISEQPGPDVSTSQLLRAIATKYALDKHISEPISVLADAVAQLEQGLHHAGTLLCNDAGLKRMIFRRRAIWVAIVFAILGGIACISVFVIWKR